MANNQSVIVGGSNNLFDNIEMHQVPMYEPNPRQYSNIQSGTQSSAMYENRAKSSLGMYENTRNTEIQ